MKLLLFEWKKLIRTRAYPLFLLITFIVISGIFLFNLSQQDQIAEKKRAEFTKIRHELMSQNSTDRYLYEEQGDEIAGARLEVGKKLSGKINELVRSFSEDNWQRELKLEIESYEMALEYLSIEDARFKLSPSEMEKRMKLNEELLLRGLPKEDFDLSIQTSIFMKKIITLINNPIGFIILLFVLGMLITREFEDRNILLVFTLPVTRIQYIIVKYLSVLLSGILWLALVFSLSYLLPHFFGKNVGNVFEYPLYTSQNEFLDSGQYITQAIYYSLSFIAFALALLVFLGYWIRNTIVTFITLLIIFLSGWILSNYGFTFMLNPLSYQSVDQSILLTPAYYPFGIFVILVAMLLLLTITFIMNRKRGL